MRFVRFICAASFFVFPLLSHAQETSSPDGHDTLKIPGISLRDGDLIERLNTGHMPLPDVPVGTTTKTPKGTIIVSPPEKNKGWGFVLGPVGEDAMTARLSLVSPHLALMFQCQKSGTEALSLLMYGLQKPVGTSVDFTISIGLETHDLPLTVTENSDKNVSFFGVDGNAIPELLNAMSNTNSPESADTMVIDDFKGHQAHVDLPPHRDITGRMSDICRIWALDAQKRKELNGQKTPVFDGSLHTPEHP